MFLLSSTGNLNMTSLRARSRIRMTACNVHPALGPRTACPPRSPREAGQTGCTLEGLAIVAHRSKSLLDVAVGGLLSRTCAAVNSVEVGKSVQAIPS